MYEIWEIWMSHVTCGAIFEWVMSHVNACEHLNTATLHWYQKCLSRFRPGNLAFFRSCWCLRIDNFVVQKISLRYFQKVFGYKVIACCISLCRVLCRLRIQSSGEWLYWRGVDSRVAKVEWLCWRSIPAVNPTWTLYQHSHSRVAIFTVDRLCSRSIPAVNPTWTLRQHSHSKVAIFRVVWSGYVDEEMTVEWLGSSAYVHVAFLLWILQNSTSTVWLYWRRVHSRVDLFT